MIQAPPSPTGIRSPEAEFEYWYHQGNAQLNAEQLPEAVYSLRKALEFKPDSAAYHNLGVAYAKQNLIDDAIAAFRRAIELRPDASDSVRNLGVAHTQKGNLDEAAGCFVRALELDPNNAQACLDFANLFLGQGKLEEAVGPLQQALRIRPDFAAAHHNLGRALARQGKHPEAIASFEQAARFKPDLAEAHHDLGVACQEAGRYEDAAAAFRRALKFCPRSAQTLGNLGAALAELHQEEESLKCYHEALRLAPDMVEIHNNFGNSLRMMGRLDEALPHFRRADELKPNDAGIYNNLGIVHVCAGRVHEALACYERAAELAPEYASAHLNRAFAWLSLGDFERGWEEYEWRWKERGVAPRDFTQPHWDGSPLDGKPILLHAEQGLGDTLQFIRYAPLVRERGGFVIFEAPAPLLRLLCEAPGVDQLVGRGSPLPDFAVHCPLLGLPRLFKTDFRNLPNKMPYLFPERRRVEGWQGPVRSIPGFRVGIAWQGSKGFKADRHRSIPLKWFEPLARIPGVQLVSLQKGYGAEQIQQVADRFTVRELGPQVDQDGAFLDTAAIMQHLDLVITSDTSAAHLAGALGVPVWMALPAAADWRWLLERADSPWYPTMRLFRQKQLGDWQEVFGRLAAALAEKVQSLPPKDDGPPPLDREAVDLHDRGTDLLRQGKAAAAEPVLRQALARQHRWDTHTNLGIALAQLKKFEEAISLFRAYLDHHPQAADGYNNLGLACLDAGRLGEAEHSFRQAIRYKPGNPESHNNLGVALLRQEKWDEAAASSRESLRLRENYAEAHQNLAFVLRQQKRVAESLPHALRVLELRPESAQAHMECAMALVGQRRLEDAEYHLRRATALQPDLPDAFNNLGILLGDLQWLDEAETCLERAVQLQPDSADAHRNLAMVLLASGQLERGWREYEWRWKCRGVQIPPELPPRWDGSPLEGRSLLVWAEQGLGDTLHMARYLPLVKRRGGKVLFACQPALLPLLKSSPLGIDQVVAQAGVIPQADFSVPLMSLPGLFGTTLETIPAEIPYLTADPALVARWRQHLRHVKGYRVGIAWQGNPGYGGDCYRSIPLKHFAALAQIEGIQLLSLQKHHGTEQLGANAGEVLPLDLGRQVDEAGAAFLDSAAVLKNLDLVVTLDSSLAHLAGALGVPTWMPLSTCSDWRWLRGRDDSPWYPTLRLFRQRTRGDLDDVFARIAAELRRRAAAAAAGRPVGVEVGAGELVDKITILEIKRERIPDAAKRGNVQVELEALLPAYGAVEGRHPDVAGLKGELKAINEVLWEIEDKIRDCEMAGAFGHEFVALARSVYKTNDRRAEVKRRINELAGSRIVEEKGYHPYSP